MERDFDSGKKINKTIYNKVKRLESDYRQRAIEKLEILNRNSNIKTCMPPKFPPPKPEPPPIKYV